MRPRDASDAAGPLARLAEPAARGRACTWRLALCSSLVRGQMGRTLGRATPRRRDAPAEVGVLCERGARGGSYDI